VPGLACASVAVDVCVMLSTMKLHFRLTGRPGLFPVFGLVLAFEFLVQGSVGDLSRPICLRSERHRLFDLVPMPERTSAPRTELVLLLKWTSGGF
jgi:hypothetical protein